MTVVANTSVRGSRASVRPGANWAGWAGYVPTARGPAERRARAAAAGLLDDRRGAERDAALLASSPRAEGTMNLDVLETVGRRSRGCSEPRRRRAARAARAARQLVA